MLHFFRKVEHFYRMKKKDNRNINILIHLIFWVLMLHLLFDISGLYYSFLELFDKEEQRMDEAFLLMPIMIALFYWNSDFLVAKFFNKKSWWKYLLSIVISFALSLFIGFILFEIIDSNGYQINEVDDHFDFLDNLFLLNILVIGISASLGISKIALQNAAQKKEAEHKQKEAELKYLTTQVNPHFLFNTLNTLYALAAEEDASQTTEAILKLSEIMRYPLKEGAEKRVLLTKEIKFLEDYIELQKLRLGETYPVHFDVKGILENNQIAPLLFIPFVENAFKYGVSQRERNPIKIALNYQNGVLHFYCKNSIVQNMQVESNELGIENVRERLMLLYEKTHQLEIKREKNQFVVDLKIEI